MTKGRPRQIDPVLLDRIPLAHKLPLTRLRMQVARAIYYALRLFLRTDHREVERKGIRYALDLSEGVDLAVYLFGGYQRYITDSKHFTLQKDAVVLDIGAHIGSMSLRFAQVVPEGRVYAFEPADSAFARLRRNLALNPGLSGRITAEQRFVSDRTGPDHPLRAFSSWKLTNGLAGKPHPLHGGIRGPTQPVRSITVDDYCREKSIGRVDLIKIDTDGHDFNVLKGAKGMIERYRPYIIFEIGFYLAVADTDEIGRNLTMLIDRGYRLMTCRAGRCVTIENLYRMIPYSYTADILAVPSSS